MKSVLFVIMALMALGMAVSSQELTISGDSVELPSPEADEGSGRPLITGIACAMVAISFTLALYLILQRGRDVSQKVSARKRSHQKGHSGRPTNSGTCPGNIPARNTGHDRTGLSGLDK